MQQLQKDLKLKMEQFLKLSMDNKYFNYLIGVLGCLMIVSTPLAVFADSESDQEQDSMPIYWYFYSTSSWHTNKDTICCNRLDGWVYRMLNFTVDVEGKKYYPIESAPLVLPTLARKSSNRGDSDWYALGIRREGGCVYVNYNQYVEYLTRSYDGETFNPSFGNPNYIPYHLTVDGELILYDYNKQVGDKYRTVEGYDDIWITAKDSVTISDGKRHCRLTLSNGLVLIEGIGCINSNGRLIDYLNPAKQYWNSFTYLKYVYDDNGNTLYGNTTTKVKESDVLGISEKRAPINSFVLYDFQGRMMQHPNKGIYIQNGRKVVVK